MGAFFQVCIMSTHDASMGLVYLPTFTIKFNSGMVYLPTCYMFDKISTKCMVYLPTCLIKSQLNVGK